MERATTAIVTAGGTREPIDDVRVVANVSSGRFGAAIANALARAGVRVLLLGSRELLSHPDWLDPTVETHAFASYADLASSIQDLATGQRPDLFFMCAAVADYSPVPAAGKISSESDSLVITMRRNPKILTSLRDLCGPRAFIAGFKLLSGASREALVEAALRQARSADLSLTVANDLAEINEGLHPVILVAPDGETRRIDGGKAEVAAELVRHCLEAESKDEIPTDVKK